MFQSESSPPVPPDAELRSLRRSLNRPVLAIDELPVGPASAALAIHAGADGPRLTLAVRSARGGRVVFFRPDAALGAPGDPALAAEAALSFAEGMGFLFDDDLLERGFDPAQAARAWADLLEESAPDEDEWTEEAPPHAEAPLLLSKFRFLSSIAAECLLSPPPPSPPDGPAASHFVLRLLSRF